MGKMKEIYNTYAEEWDDHDCRRDDPDDGCFCEMYNNFEQYADERYMQDYGSTNIDSEDCDDCGEDCGGDMVGCGDCGYSHCEHDPNCHATWPITWSQVAAMQDPPDPPDPADPPTWNQVIQDPNVGVNTPSTTPADPNDELTIPIDLKELDLEVGEVDGFTIREPNDIEKLTQGNAGKSVGDLCWRCKGNLQQFGGGDPFCGKCECELEKT